MKRLITQLALLIAVLCASVPALAYDCKVDGIYYNLKGNTAEVTSGDDNYEGAIKIPRSVRYNGSSYSVTSIGERAFYECSGLTSVTIPNSVTIIGGIAFIGCSGLTSVTIPNSVISIGNYAFAGCSGLTSIVVDKGNVNYDSRDNCNAIIETAANTLIIGCKSTIIPNSVTSIGKSAFYCCSGLTSVTIPNSVTSIGKQAFFFCPGLTSLTIPVSVTSIGEYAFHGCSGLTSVTIPNSVTSIDSSAFSRCSGLTSLTCLAPNPPTCGNRAFDGVDRTKCTLYVLKKSVNLYKVADQWKDFYNIVGSLGVDDITVDGDDAETLYEIYVM